MIGRLLRFITSTQDQMKSELSSWIQSEFAGDRAALAAAAQGKNFKAEFAMMLFNVFNDDKGNNGYPVKWFDRVFNQGSSRLYEARICFRISNAKEYAAFDGDSLRREVKLNTAMRLILWPAKSGVMVAEHILGMLLYCSEGESEGCKPDILDAARWIRKAAKQGLAEAQYELGEMFRHGVFCDVHMRFARKYIRRAAKQGHLEATARMRELHSCVMCGADDAPSACGRCHQARYCNASPELRVL